MRKFNVLQITQSLGGGVQKYITHLCEHLDRTRFSITACFSKKSEKNQQNNDIPFSDACRQADIPYFVLSMQRAINPWKDFIAFLSVFQQIRHRGFDIVHAHSSKAGFLARVAARLARVPVVVYSPHAFSFDGPQPALKIFFLSFLKRLPLFFATQSLLILSAKRNLL
jgi:glycosyltransferase involved in cell wall biosynthesis